MIGFGKQALFAALLAALFAGAAAGQGSSEGEGDESGLLGAVQRQEGKDAAPVAPEPVMSALDAAKDLGAAIAESGKKVRLLDMRLGPKSSTLRLEMENELDAYDVKAAVNREPRHITIEEGRITSDPKSGRVVVEFRVAPRADAAPGERRPTPDESLAGNDLGRHLQVAAARMKIQLERFEKVGRGGPAPAKVSYRFSNSGADPDAMARFLSQLVLSWPGLEIEELCVQEAPRPTKDDPRAWRTTVLVSVTPPKAAPR